MGSTGYWDTTAEDAKAREMSGCTIIAKSGNWYIARNHNNVLFAVHFHTTRFGDEVVIKGVSMDMGPNEVPSEAFFRRWVKLSAAEPGYQINEYEQAWRTQCEAVYVAKNAAKDVKVGDTFKVTRPYNYGGDIGEQDTFTLIDAKRRIARTVTGAHVRLPRGWQSNLDHPTINSHKVVSAAIS